MIYYYTCCRRGGGGGESGGSKVIINFDAESLFQIRLVGLLTTCSEFVVRIPRTQHTNKSSHLLYTLSEH